MKIVYLTAGAAGMYCGSCLRDNTLAAAMRAQGREVLLVPLFTPIRTDEPDASEQCVFYGAINVYLQQRFALFRYAPRWLNRLLDSPALLRKVAHSSVDESLEQLGQLTLSTMQGESGRQGREQRKLIQWLARIRPNLVNLPNAMFVHLARPIREKLDIPVLCTLTGEDIFIDKLPDPYRRQVIELIRQHGREVNGFVSVSEYYARCCGERFGIESERMHVVRPGVRIDDLHGGRQLSSTEPFVVGYLARVCPDKGLHVLCDAVRILRLRGRKVKLVAAGYLGAADRAYLDAQHDRMIEAGLGDAFEYLGEVDRSGKLAMLRSVHVLSVPTVYPDPKGLFVLEAMANGIPVIQPRHGAFPELVEATGGGLLVEPDNPELLADGIVRLMDDPVLREQLACQGRKSVHESFTDMVMANQTWSVYQRYLSVDNGEYHE